MLAHLCLEARLTQSKSNNQTDACKYLPDHFLTQTLCCKGQQGSCVESVFLTASDYNCIMTEKTQDPIKKQPTVSQKLGEDTGDSHSA